jgi:hypothetical protein
MVASKPRTLANLLNAVAAKPENKTKQEEINSARGHIGALTRFQNELKRTKDEKEQEQVRKKIRGKIKEIARILADLLATEEFATEKDPLKFYWPKPPSDKYPTLYFGPRSGQRIAQSTLKKAASGSQDAIGVVERKLTQEELKDWQAKNKKIETYTPHGSGTLPGGEGPIGITGNWRVAAGKEIQLPEVAKSTPGGDLLNDDLRPYGFSPSKEKLDADHVVEVQLGGDAHTRGNLWPLNRSINRSSGKILSRMSFKLNDKKKVPMSVLKARAQKKIPTWLKIDRTRS